MQFKTYTLLLPWDSSSLTFRDLDLELMLSSTLRSVFLDRDFLSSLGLTVPPAFFFDETASSYNSYSTFSRR
jgi:hypothetical protein